MFKMHCKHYKIMKFNDKLAQQKYTAQLTIQPTSSNSFTFLLTDLFFIISIIKSEIFCSILLPWVV